MKEIVRKIASEFNIEFAALMAFIEVESSGKGFDPATGRIMIQFEPAWFRKLAPGAPAAEWSANKVDRQPAEWRAFNSAYVINPDAAMQSTSIGLGQVMGLHYKRLGYATVGTMWDDAKRSEEKQIWQIAKFITTDNKLLNALKNKNWHMVATLYNGAGYKALASRLGRTPYDISLKEAYLKYTL
ncbi:hypothetical protein SDC9_20204 [bioreactor metagenome]|uniref:N-acetylmuramidase domain-containing protein n=1 Tax=bioreactor metagenome TaxID=1076179 RepID=A0A644U652_9ZZZZ